MKHAKGSEIRRISIVLMLILKHLFIIYPEAIIYVLLSDAQTSPSSQNQKSWLLTLTKIRHYQHILAIFGTSSDNAKTRCTLSALLNDERPYQNTHTVDHPGDDYSKWTFTFDPYYTLIKEGQNEIVSKIVCENDGGIKITAFNKVNVTGSTRRNESIIIIGI